MRLSMRKYKTKSMTKVLTRLVLLMPRVTGVYLSGWIVEEGMRILSSSFMMAHTQSRARANNRLFSCDGMRL
jgi:hypothetical protein